LRYVIGVGAGVFCCRNLIDDAGFAAIDRFFIFKSVKIAPILAA